jgi:hypothetical protein
VAFVNYLLEVGTSHDNLHFRPYWSRCNTCFLGLDFIGKSETMAKDRIYLKSALGLKVRTLNTFAKVHMGKPTHSAALDMFRTLTRTQVQALYEMYKPDFELFGYEPDVYLSYARTT